MIERLSKTAVLTLFTAITGMLGLFSLIATCYINKNEHVYYTYTSGSAVFGFLILLLLSYLYYKFRLRHPAPLKIGYLLLAAGLLGLTFILVTHLPPKADQNACLTVSEQMHTGDYSAFSPGNYMAIYPQQTGLVLIYFLLGFLPGASNLIVLQFINVIAYVAFLFALAKLSLKLLSSKTLANGTVLMAILFLPLLFYTSFLYGTLAGLAASTYAIVKAMDYMERRRALDGQICILLCGVSVLLKKNYLIVCIAIGIVLLIHALFKKHKRALLTLLLLAASCFFFLTGPIILGERLSRQHLNQGMPAVAWVTMGLQPGSRANGWYNGYSLATYQDNDCNADKTAAAARYDLDKHIHSFLETPSDTASFFIKKLASEWNEPTFECFLITNTTTLTKEHSPFVYWLLKDTSHPLLSAYLDVFLSFLYLGAFFYSWHHRKQLSIYDMIPMIAFIGGFLFHSFWEAKGQYTLCYFLLLFPYTLKGYCLAFERMESNTKANEDFTFRKLVQGFAPFSIVILTFLCFYLLHSFLPSVQEEIVTCNAEYLTYINTPIREATLLKGTYRFKACNSNQYLTFSSKKNGSLTAFLKKGKKDAQIVAITESVEATKIAIPKIQKTFSSLKIKQVDTERSKRRKNIYHLSHTVKWHVIKATDTTYLIKNSLNYALTRASDGSLTLTPCESSNKDQQWTLEDA